MTQLVLPEPVGPQGMWLDSPARRKVLRIGRRGGKTRAAIIAAIAGHGPGPDGARRFPGILAGPEADGKESGGDVVWLAQDYPNLTTVVWREELVPRFKPLEDAGLCTINSAEHFVSVHGRGTLYLRSAEAVSGIRGIGKRLRGVIVDEAAHLDLEKALLDVILPACLDNRAWLMLMSTTNAGSDGNTKHRVPSYFNLICEEIRAGLRGPEWQEFTGTAYDNPTLSSDGVDELVREYAPESPALKQEVYAELLRSGVGLALPNVTAETHMVERFAVPNHWTQFGAFDWGFNHPYVFGWFAADEDGNVVLVDTLWGRQEIPEEIAERVSKVFPVKQFRYIHAGHDCWADTRARGERVPTIAEQFARLHIPLARANISRVSGLNNLRLYLHKTDETKPRFTMMKTDGNRRVLQTLMGMQVDPANVEDALKVDADSAGRGGDDGYDMVRYGLASRPMVARLPDERKGRMQDRAVPFDYTKRRQPRRDVQAEIDADLRRGIPNRHIHQVPRWES